MWYRIEYIHTSPSVILETNALQHSGTPAGVGGDQLLLVVSSARFMSTLMLVEWMVDKNCC